MNIKMILGATMIVALPVAASAAVIEGQLDVVGSSTSAPPPSRPPETSISIPRARSRTSRRGIS